jgi:hypothetical protein
MVDDEDDRWDDVEARVCSACHVMITISASQSGKCIKTNDQRRGAEDASVTHTHRLHD